MCREGEGSTWVCECVCVLMCVGVGKGHEVSVGDRGEEVIHCVCLFADVSE